MSHQGLDAYLCCLVGADQYAVRGDAVTLVARAEQMRPAPDADGRLGVLMRGGREVPVYSLAGLLGGASDGRTADRHLVVTSAAGDAFALLVDRVVRATLAGARELPLPPFAGAQAVRWFTGLLTLAETSCLVLNPEGLRPGAPDRAPLHSETRRAAPRSGSRVEDLAFVFSSGALPGCDGAAKYALGATRLAAIVQAVPSVRLPGAAPQIVALGWWRDAAVPVIDFSEAACVTRAARRFALLRRDNGSLVAIAIGADAVLRRATAGDARDPIAPLPAHVSGVFLSGVERVALLNLQRVV